jgi:hypothetical protein
VVSHTDWNRCSRHVVSHTVAISTEVDTSTNWQRRRNRGSHRWHPTTKSGDKTIPWGRHYHRMLASLTWVYGQGKARTPSSDWLASEITSTQATTG